MSKRDLVLLMLVGCAIGAPWLVGADEPAGNLGKKIAPFLLTDPRDQTRFALADCRDKKAVVVVFLGTECPLNNAYLRRLIELHKEYAGRDVQFVGINANRTDSAPRVAEHARKHELPFPVLKDAGNVVADQFGARRTPEAFVLDAGGILRYQGRIDDQFGIGYQRPQPSRRDLALAIEEVLAGKEVSKPTTPVAGCLIARMTAAKNVGAVTYTKHVARLLQNHCQECHRPGQIGPMSLLTYDDAAAWAETIREVVQEQRMPPWYADPKHGKFANDRRLSTDERDTLLKWIELGCPQGDAKELPAPRDWPEGWRIGKPDLVLTMPEDFDVPAQAPRGGLPYRHVVIDPGFNEDRWVVRAEARPGAVEVVHHIVVFIVPPGQRFDRDDPRNQILVGTAPGDMPTLLPAGTAKRIPTGSRLIAQIHYTPNGRAQKDRSSIGLIFSQAADVREVRTVPIFNALFRIPPGADSHAVEATFRLPRNAKAISFMPHMHLRGKDFTYEATFPDGKKETLLSVPRYNFHWQSVYRLAEPLPLPQGTSVRCVAHFDNSAGNLNNPDPARAVFWGDQTWEEMMIGWLDLVYDP